MSLVPVAALLGCAAAVAGHIFVLYFQEEYQKSSSCRYHRIPVIVDMKEIYYAT